jgi:O-antigen ligase
MSQDYPVFGVGPNMFYDNYPAYGITEYKTWVSRNLEESTTHNYYLFMLAEQGFIGMILYAFLIILIFWKGQTIYYRLGDKRDKQVVLAVIGLLGAVFVNNFFSELLETDKIGSLFYMGLAILVVYDLKSRKSENVII